MIELGTKRELFVDKYLIEELFGKAVLRLSRPLPREIVLWQDMPWETGKGAMSYITVLKDDRTYHMYYKGAMMRDIPKEAEKAFGIADIIICYAKSDDGIHWEKPDLGLIEFDGSKKNNIVWKGIGSHGFTPFIDTRPDCSSGERYKAVGLSKTDVEPKPAGTKYLFVLKSPDGLHWTPMKGPKEYGGIFDRHDGEFDSQNTAFWDETSGCYRIYFRKRRDADRADLAGREDGEGNYTAKAQVRDIKTAVSADCLNWSEPQFLEYGDSPDEELYTNQIIPYPRAPHIMVGFPSRYVEGRGPLTEWHKKMSEEHPGRTYISYTDGLFMSSRDGRTFHRWGEAFLRPGMPESRVWSYGACYQSYGLVETASDIPDGPREWSVYACQGYRNGPGMIRRFTLRLDGFASVRAPFSGGTVLTKPLIHGGTQLELNYATSAAGSIRVEIQDIEGNPITGLSLDECNPLFGNTLNRKAVWKSGAAPKTAAGTPVRLLFELKDADLFALQFTR